MPRIPRSQLPDGIYHASGLAVAEAWLFRDEDDYRFFLALFALTVGRFDWSVHAFCLMGTHYHVVVECTRQQLSDGMELLNGRYASGYNAKYGRKGHVFGSRFSARVIESEEYLAAAIDYVLNNPVKAGLCATADDWAWSGTRYRSRDRYDSRPASSEMSTLPFNAWDTGQFSLAFSPARRKPSSSRPGTRPRTRSAISVIPVPGTNVDSAETCSRSGTWPACASPWDSAIEKHAACAAAISSSGLVVPPEASSDLDAHVTS